jgi:hypothetical protein
MLRVSRANHPTTITPSRDTSRCLDDRLVGMLAERPHAIAEPTRIRILTQKHLSVLYSAGIVTRRRAGNRAYYALADYTACLLIRDAITSLVAHVEELAEIVHLEP